MIDIKFKAPLLDVPDKDGIQKVLRRAVLYKEQIDTEHIKSVGWVYKKNGSLDTKRCRINHADLGSLIIEHSYDYIAELRRNNRIVIKGFKHERRSKKR